MVFYRLDMAVLKCIISVIRSHVKVNYKDDTDFKVYYRSDFSIFEVCSRGFVDMVTMWYKNDMGMVKMGVIDLMCQCSKFDNGMYAQLISSTH